MTKTPDGNNLSRKGLFGFEAEECWVDGGLVTGVIMQDIVAAGESGGGCDRQEAE